MTISLSGYYHIIYTDHYKINHGLISEFIVQDFSNDKVLFRTRLDIANDFTPLTINAVINVQANTKIGLYLSYFNPGDSILDGSKYSTFFIKYLGN